ncbi:efflux RND transporter periplasmic adaptor subunit [Fluviicola taffensis]|uniref:Efflux transporter, RND family, MFP subunit n=1 Tax=Fluviicola taffensis (strain DSM 16823 / NCIMB 13979 / RW262) TaxID=755732 RepID=F2IFJ9_FLUTR|nr:efflux RND transporter periplasmic adaptor subunit [Fluviicola taffensis]AEA45713.1 efflux transporter, RND family, MFP subunit [Fluviicola taffensis DSM 16823]
MENQEQQKKKGVFRRIILPALIGVLLLFIVINKLGNNKEKMEANASITDKKMTIFPVTISEPKMETVSQDFELNGNFVPDHQLSFVSEASGRVRSLNIENGDYVNEGKVIATLDSEQIRIDLSLAKTTLDKAKSDLEKYERMVASGAVNKQQVEEMRMTMNTADAKVKTLQHSLKLTTIVSPISGVVSNVAIEKGSYLAPGTAIADIVDIKSLKMSVKLLDAQVVRVQAGQSVQIVPDLYANSTITGKVASVSPQADGSKKFDTEIRFVNPVKTPLKSGMTGKVKFTFGGTKEALTIPIKCLVGSIKDPKVYIIQDGQAKLTKIEIGSVDDEKIEIVSGLSKGMKVVKTGQLNIDNGSKVKIIK